MEIRRRRARKKNKTLSEDQRDDLKDEIQELTKKYETLVITTSKEREQEVLDT